MGPVGPLGQEAQAGLTSSRLAWASGTICAVMTGRPFRYSALAFATSIAREEMARAT